MTEQEFFDNVMLDLLEDELGLWEMVGMAWAAFPDRARSDQTGIAQDLVKDLLDRGWVDLYFRAVRFLPRNNAEYGPPVPVERDHVATTLADASAWDYAKIQKAPARYFIYANETGRREFHDDGLRRGLYKY